jgi:hypothetical protein
MNEDTTSITFDVHIMQTGAYSPSTLTITSSLTNFGYEVATNPADPD